MFEFSWYNVNSLYIFFFLSSKEKGHIQCLVRVLSQLVHSSAT